MTTSHFFEEYINLDEAYDANHTDDDQYGGYYAEINNVYLSPTDDGFLQGTGPWDRSLDLTYQGGPGGYFDGYDAYGEEETGDQYDVRSVGTPGTRASTQTTSSAGSWRPASSKASKSSKSSKSSAPSTKPGSTSSSAKRKGEQNKEESPSSPSSLSGNNKRDKFLERNRVAASKCRQKKKEWMNELEETKSCLENQNSHLQMEYNGLLGEVSRMKDQIMQHAGCSDANIDKWIENEARRFVQSTSDKYDREGKTFSPRSSSSQVSPKDMESPLLLGTGCSSTSQHRHARRKGAGAR